MRFTARLSVAQPWTVTVVDSAGAPGRAGHRHRHRRSTGRGTPSLAPPDRYSWTIASANARSATGTLGAGAAFAVQKTVAFPAAVPPGETTTVSYTLSAAASVNVSLVSQAGATLATLLVAKKPAGLADVRLYAAARPPEWRLRDRHHGHCRPKTATVAVPVTVDDILTGFTATGPSLSFTLTRAPIALTFQVLQGTQVVATPAVPPLAAGPQTETWDGRLADGSRAPDGTYTLALSITDDVTTFTRTATVTLDTARPGSPCCRTGISASASRSPPG